MLFIGLKHIKKDRTKFMQEGESDMMPNQTNGQALFDLIVAVGIAVGIVVLTLRVPEDQIADLIVNIVTRT